MALTSSMEDYLEAVLILQQKRSSVRSVDIAVHLGVTKPSVSRAVKELSKMGYLLKEADGTLSLTQNGQKIAKQVYEKHLFFTKCIWRSPAAAGAVVNGSGAVTAAAV